MIDRFNGALLLRKNVLKEMREAPDVVRQGLMVVLLVGLLVGGVDGVRRAFFVLDPRPELMRVQLSMERSLDQQAMMSNTERQRAFITLVKDNLPHAFAIVYQVQELPAPLPRSLRAVLQGLGVFVSRPLTFLQWALVASIFTHIAARWFGGQGTLQQMIGLGVLSVAPHALDALVFVPVLGTTFLILAWGWGFAVLVVGTSIAHRLETGRALLATTFFPLIGIFLASLGCCIFLAWVAMAASAAV